MEVSLNVSNVFAVNIPLVYYIINSIYKKILKQRENKPTDDKVIKYLLSAIHQDTHFDMFSNQNYDLKVTLQSVLQACNQIDDWKIIYYFIHNKLINNTLSWLCYHLKTVSVPDGLQLTEELEWYH